MSLFLCRKGSRLLIQRGRTSLFIILSGSTHMPLHPYICIMLNKYSKRLTEGTLPEVFVRGWGSWSLHWSTCTTSSGNTTGTPANRCFFSKTWWIKDLNYLMNYRQYAEAMCCVNGLNECLAGHWHQSEIAPGFRHLYTFHSLSVYFKSELNALADSSAAISWQHRTVQMFKLITSQAFLCCNLMVALLIILLSIGWCG